jgi:hypothetical protein
MSKKINVNPDHYKVAGRERQGEDIVQTEHKTRFSEAQHDLEHRARQRSESLREMAERATAHGEGEQRERESARATRPATRKKAAVRKAAPRTKAAKGGSRSKTSARKSGARKSATKKAATGTARKRGAASRKTAAARRPARKK